MRRRWVLIAAFLFSGILLFVTDDGTEEWATPVPRAPGSSGEPFHRSGFIDEERPGVMAHVASIAPLGPTEMAAVWYAGSREGARDVAIFFATYDGHRWQAPRRLVDRRSCSRETGMRVKKIGNPVLFRDLQSRLWLVYSSVVEGGWSATSLNYKVSCDSGKTWTPSRKLFLSPLLNLTYNVKNKPVLLADGSFLLPVYHEMIAKRSAVLHLKPEKEGLSYRIRRMTFSGRAIQPAMVSLGDRRLMALFRNMDKGHVLASSSSDAGYTWSEPHPLDLPNPDAGFDAVRLGSGAILAAINNSREDRSDLSLAVSDDEGASWRIDRVLEQHAGMEYSYPSLTIDDSGLIHLVYTYQRKSIKHVIFNEGWLLGEEAEGSAPSSQPPAAIPGEPSSTPGNDGFPLCFCHAAVGVSLSGVLSYATALAVLLSLGTAPLARLRFLRLRGTSRLGLFIATAGLSLLLTMVRVDGLSAVDLLRSASPSLSILLLGLALHHCLDRVFGLPLLRPEELPWWAAFVLLVSLPLFASVLGLIPADLYACGYQFSWGHVFAIGFGLWVACRGHHGLAVLLLAALAAHSLGLLPSGNIFDALTDGLGFFAAVAIVVQSAGQGLKNRSLRGFQAAAGPCSSGTDSV